MTATDQPKQVLVSGIAASGLLHIGNYIGALHQWRNLQHRYDSYWFIADLHALTVPHDIVELDLGDTARHMAALYMAAGLDPDEATIFRQSDVRAHTELNWLLACVTPTGWLNRMTQFKVKAQGRQDEKISTGLYTYPVLQAADILLYGAHRVPVGADQVQHVELARDIAHRFNTLFGLTFVLPEALVPTTGARIMGLDDSFIKMSKTTAVTKTGHAIGLLDPPTTIERAIMRAQTDSGGDITFGTGGPGVVNLLTIYKALTGKDEADIETEFAGRGYGTLKEAVLSAVLDTIEPIQKRYAELILDRPFLNSVLARGAAYATATAESTLQDVRAALKLDPRHL